MSADLALGNEFPRGNTHEIKTKFKTKKKSTPRLKVGGGLGIKLKQMTKVSPVKLGKTQ